MTEEIKSPENAEPAIQSPLESLQAEQVPPVQTPSNQRKKGS
jgi:hypothetical protein